jgi:hypothetical protein
MLLLLFAKPYSILVFNIVNPCLNYNIHRLDAKWLYLFPLLFSWENPVLCLELFSGFV